MHHDHVQTLREKVTAHRPPADEPPAGGGKPEGETPPETPPADEPPTPPKGGNPEAYDEEAERQHGSRWVDEEDQAEFDELRRRLNRPSDKLTSGGLDPERMEIYGRMGYLIAKHGIHEFAEWARRMLALCGETVRPYLQELYERLPQQDGGARLADTLTSAADVRRTDVSTMKPRTYYERPNPPRQPAAETPETPEGENPPRGETPTAEGAPQAEDTAPMPLTKSGEPDWQAASPRRTHTYIYNGEAGLSRSEADAYVSAWLEQTRRELDKAEKAPEPKMGTNLQKYKDEKAKRQQKIDAAKAAADYWEQVRRGQQEVEEHEAEAAQAIARDAAQAVAEDAAREATTDAAQQAAEEAVQEITEENIKQAARDAAQQAAADAAQQAAAEAARKAAAEAARQVAADALRQGSTENAAREAATEAARKAAADAARQAAIDAARKAAKEAAKEAADEARRREREALKGVPDWSEDTPADARARGFRRSAGHKYERQQPVEHTEGKAVSVKFADDDTQQGHVGLMEAEQLQPSHRNGQPNVMHFLPEAQPKKRTDAASVISADKIAANVNPEEITGSVIAYTGAPSVNARGEAIQGNNRLAALRTMWESHPEQAEKYRRYLIDHAADFGLDPEQVKRMKHPVLVNVLDVTDERAIHLGQYDDKDITSGGEERIKAKNAVQKMGKDIKSFAELLLNSTDEEASFAQLIDRNAAEVLEWMQRKGYITPTQYQSAFDKRGGLKAEAANDLRAIMYESIFRDGAERLAEAFDRLPAKAQRAILATAYRDFDSPASERLLPELQASIEAYGKLLAEPTFAAATNLDQVLQAVDVWARQYQFDDADGSSFLPAEKYSNLALHLAAMYRGSTQRLTQAAIAELLDRIQGARGANLFEGADTRRRTLPEAVKEVLNIDYNGRRAAETPPAEVRTDKQGNPVDADGKLITERVGSIEELTNADFDAPKRSVELPRLPESVDKAIGAGGKPVIIKKSILEKNAASHKDLTPADSREILQNIAVR